MTARSLAVWIGICCCMSSCVWLTPAAQRLSKSRDAVSKGYREELGRRYLAESGGELQMTWKTGIESLFMHNPELIQADHQVADARLSQRQIWKNMLPSLSVSGRDSFTAGDIGSAFADPTFRINSFVALGNLLNLPKDVYTRKLAYMGAEFQAEQRMRQQVIGLYRLFQEQYLLAIEQKAISAEADFIQQVAIANHTEGLALRLANREAQKQWQSKQETFKAKVSDFFMSNYSEVDLKNSSLPKITYTASELDFTDTKRWGFLQFNLLALEDIAERGNILDTYLRYLPRANLSVSAPSLFNSDSNRSFDINETRLSPSLTWNLDTRGTISQQINRIKRQGPMREWSKDKRRKEEITRLLEGKALLQSVQDDLRKNQQVVSLYKQSLKEGMVTDPEQALRALRQLKEKEIMLSAQEIEICTAFWLIDEQRWASLTKYWRDTRPVRLKQRKKTHSKKLSFYQKSSTPVS